MPQKFIYKPKKYNTSKILTPKQIKDITKPKSKYTNLKKNKTVPIIKPGKNNYDSVKIVKPALKKKPIKYEIIKPKISPIVRVKPKTNVKILKPKVIKKVLKKKRIYHGRVDQSLSTLKKMKQMGYDRITFEARNSACHICQDLNGYTFDLGSWLVQLKHSAPIFEISHPNCLDYVRVWDTENVLPPIWVNWTGNYIFNQP